MTLNPVFDRHVFEGATIGRMLLNYGELEVTVAMLLGNALGSQDKALRTMFRITGESARIGVADALMRDTFKASGLASEYADAIGAMRWCIKVRNQYSHCQWGDSPGYAGIFFTQLVDSAKASEGFEYWFRHVDDGLLMEQLEYFEYAADCLVFLNFDLLRRQEKLEGHNAPMPLKRQQPNLHNPPALHIPPWLTEDEKRRHIERTRAEDTSSDSPPEKKEKTAPKPSARQRREKALKAKRE
jgi:hypothetical protein